MRGRAWAALHWTVATCSMTSAAFFTLSAGDLVLSLSRRRAMCFACLMYPSWSLAESCLEEVCDPELLLLGFRYKGRMSSNSKSFLHSGHVGVSSMSSINFSTHDEQYVCPRWTETTALGKME